MLAQSLVGDAIAHVPHVVGHDHSNRTKLMPRAAAAEQLLGAQSAHTKPPSA
jgi:hypothetical protein